MRVCAFFGYVSRVCCLVILRREIDPFGEAQIAWQKVDSEGPKMNHLAEPGSEIGSFGEA